MAPSPPPDVVGNAALLELIGGEVRRDGRITFERYMELALYHPEHGYYSSAQPRIGPDGDYYTSTDVSPLFGATIGRQLREMWELLGRPRPLEVWEYGAGKGLLAADVLGWAGAAHPDLYVAIEYTIEEVSPGLRQVQRERLRGLPVRWADPGEARPHFLVGCTLSNEVADALPFHRVRWEGGRLRELWVVERDGRLTEEVGELSTPQLLGYVEDASISLAEGQTADVNLRAMEWMRSQVRALSRGWVLTIDYGAPAEELYGPAHPDGTLACYYRHTLGRDPFVRVGEQDVTAHVDFSALARAARQEGGRVEGLTTQAFFLASLGLGEALVWSAERRRGVHLNAPTEEYERDRAAVEQLIRPDGLGGFRVLVCSRGMPEHHLLGFSLGAKPI